MQSKTKDGGPAFPTQAEPFLDGQQGRHPASAWGLEPKPGMSLRDWFAGMALSSRGLYGANVRENEVAQECYRIADAMLVERSKYNE